MPIPVQLPSIESFNQSGFDQSKDSSGGGGGLCHTIGISNLNRVFPESKKLPNPQRFFNFSPTCRYRYLRHLGHGAYGYVWYVIQIHLIGSAAMDLEAGIPVAIKKINSLNNDLVARRTLRELRLLRHFQGHPNITNIRDILPPKSTGFEELYVSQELMDADLCHVIHPSFKMTEEHVRLFVFQILCGLSALHSANVIHRDLKPGNLLWRHTGELKICDFGLARGMDESFDGMDSTMTAYVATRWYRAPEILLEKKRYVDVWSVGCIFAELLGRKIFLPGHNGNDQMALIVQKLGTPTPEELEGIPSSKSLTNLQRLPLYPKRSLESRFPHASGEAIDLLDKMLTFDPTKRITVEQALRHPFLARLASKVSIGQLISFSHFDFGFDKKCKSLIDLKSAILDEVRIYQTLSTSGLPSKVTLLHLDDIAPPSSTTTSSSDDHHAEDERVIDGLLHRHIQTHYTKTTPFNMV